MNIKMIGFVAIVLGSFAFAKAQLTPFSTAAKELLHQHVKNGTVDYAAIKKDPATLNAALTALQQTNTARLNNTERKALLINAYNIFTIKGVVDAYPLKSVMDKKDFFDATVYRFGDQKVSLNQLEKQILYKEYPDPRLHFVLVCGAISCPPLQEKAFTSENLEFLIKKLTKAAVNNPALVQVNLDDKKVVVSKIFDWYNADFTQNQNLIAYLNIYRESAIPSGFKVEYMDYNWNLNDK